MGKLIVYCCSSPDAGVTGVTLTFKTPAEEHIFDGDPNDREAALNWLVEQCSCVGQGFPVVLSMTVLLFLLATGRWCARSPLRTARS